MNTLPDNTDIDTTESTHNGKIGRLPRELREQLNRRLDQNEPGGRILDWLNALPAVQAVLQADFKGDRVNP
ncbi:MAG: hypothetical protein P4N60_01235, partial [Verrucomicrobiae bacterium]|nr:hypothetical protein [Verrucomicrobiae bacterium]